MSDKNTARFVLVLAGVGGEVVRIAFLFVFIVWASGALGAQAPNLQPLPAPNGQQDCPDGNCPLPSQACPDCGKIHQQPGAQPQQPQQPGTYQARPVWRMRRGFFGRVYVRPGWVIQGPPAPSYYYIW